MTLNKRRVDEDSELSLTLDHVDVIGSVADGQGHGFLVALDQTDHVGLLFGRHTAADHRAAFTRHVHEVLLSLLLLPVVHGLAAVWRVAGVLVPLPELLQTKATTLLLLLVQNLILHINTERARRLEDGDFQFSVSTLKA